MAYAHDDLALADKHVSDAEGLVRRQAQLIGRLDADGYDTAQARSLLSILEISLNEFRSHRDLIERELTGSALGQESG